MFIKNHSLFSFGHYLNPTYWLDSLLNPYKFIAKINFRGHPLEVVWTRRAQDHFSKQQTGLVIEMQLYFSCVVKKRVLFHTDYALEAITVNDDFSIAFNAVEAAACDPEAFVKNYPAKRIMDSDAALKMYPAKLQIDFNHNQWCGEFTV